MKRYFYFILLVSLFVSCKDDEAARLETNAREIKKNEQIFANIDKAWNFSARPLNPTAQNLLNDWSEWRLFLTELDQKPKSSIGAFQKKASILSTKVMDLNNNIPPAFNKPEIQSRIMTLATKIRSLDLYINLSYIQEEKVLKLIPEINAELASLQNQMDEIVRKKQINLEEGEAEMLRSLGKDSVSATVPKSPDLQQLQPKITKENGGIIPTMNPKQQSN